MHPVFCEVREKGRCKWMYIYKGCIYKIHGMKAKSCKEDDDRGHIIANTHWAQKPCYIQRAHPKAIRICEPVLGLNKGRDIPFAIIRVWRGDEMRSHNDNVSHPKPSRLHTTPVHALPWLLQGASMHVPIGRWNRRNHSQNKTGHK